MRQARTIFRRSEKQTYGDDLGGSCDCIRVGYEIRRRNKLARARLELDMELAGWDEQRRKQFADKLEL